MSNIRDTFEHFRPSTNKRILVTSSQVRSTTDRPPVSVTVHGRAATSAVMVRSRDSTLAEGGTHGVGSTARRGRWHRVVPRLLPRPRRAHPVRRHVHLHQGGNAGGQQG